MRRLFAWSVLALFGSIPFAQTEPVTTGTLIREMADLRHLTEFPDPAYRVVQFSSYDHRSNLPGGENWFQNSDGFGSEPVPNFEEVIRPAEGDGDGEYLICDVKGPGAIVRVWTATISGAIRVFMDEHNSPAWEGPAQEFFQPNYRMVADTAGIDIDLLQGTFAQRNAGYFPFLFGKRCRVVWLGNPKNVHFYQIQFRLYEPNAEVRPFTPDDLTEFKEDIVRTAEVLKNPDEKWKFASDGKPLSKTVEVAAKEKGDLFSLEGSGAIERLTLQVKAEDLNKALRQTVLHISFDGFPWGQVQSPIGDFFGAAPGINPYVSLPFTVLPDGSMTCRFVMPYAKSCRMWVENRSDQAVQVTASALPMKYEWNPKTSMHFRARWRIDHDLTASPQAPQDLPFLLANGKGVYVGTASLLMNTGTIPLSFGNWWGEGDEKVFVDGDFQPSLFGTGSEDYYNYAWSSVDIWQQPYCGQPRNDGPGNRGFVTNHRWHILDSMPFQQRILFSMELYSADPMPGFVYARLGYHYALPGTMDDHVAITAEDVREPRLPENWHPLAKMGAKDSVFHEAETLVDWSEQFAFAQDNLWTGDRMMVWSPEATGNEMRMEIPITEEGNYFLRLDCALNNRSGMFSAKLDGVPLKIEDKETVDLFDPYRTLSRVLSSEKKALTKGPHVLTLRSEGANEKSEGKTIGLDFVWIQKE